MEAAFNRQAISGEFFIEFEKQVKDTDLAVCLQKLQAKGVNVFTFPNDKGDSAADAIIRVLTQQEKTGITITRGKRPEEIVKKVDVKQKEAAREEELRNKEFDEKTANIIQKSIEDVNGNVKDVMGVVQSCGAELESHGAELESHGIKLDNQGVWIDEVKQDVKSQGAVMNDIKDGVCNVIPDYQGKITKLEGALEHKTKMCDIQEAKTAAQTTIVNKQKVDILSLNDRDEAQRKQIETQCKQIEAQRKQIEALSKREDNYMKHIRDLEYIVEVSKSIDNLKYISQLAQEVNKSLDNVKEINQLAKEDRVFLKDELANARSERNVSGQSAMSNDEAEEEERAAKRFRG